MVLAAAVLYGRRALVLRRRGRPVALRKVACFVAGVLAVLLAFVSPIDAIGEERLFSVHMVQHLLIGDIGPLLVVLGVDGPLLRPVLALPGLARLRALAHPLVAFPLWATDLCVWHVPRLYDAALGNAGVHALQHVLFFTCGALVWAALLEPLPGPHWFGAGRKALLLVGMWFVSLGLSQVFLWSGHAFYARYRDAPRTWGLTPLDDQQLGGLLMWVPGNMYMLGAIAAVFYVWAKNDA